MLTRTLSKISNSALVGFTLVGALPAEEGSFSGYDLARPSERWVLPDELREISGITFVSPMELVSVQDELGELFVIDPQTGSVTGRQVFAEAGDYEGIAWADGKVFVLRSDGVLFEVDDDTSPEPYVVRHETGIPGGNSEGLCADVERNRLLIAVKGPVNEEAGTKNRRMIFAFDLASRQLIPSPVFDFDVDGIRSIAEQKGIEPPAGPEPKKKKEPKIKFRVSAIAIHPITGRLFIISAADHMLFQFGLDGSCEHMEPLDPVLFNKPEGMTFNDAGALYISNEGQEGEATLLRFDLLVE